MTTQEFVAFLARHIELNPGLADAPLVVLEGGEVNGIRFGSEGVFVMHEFYPVPSDQSKWEFFEAIFTLAGIQVLGHEELVNQYWPRNYTRVVAENPWWLVVTATGYIVIGWRKRVISIDWSHTTVRKVVTDDDVTKSDTSVHAHTAAKAVEYLQALAVLGGEAEAK